MIIFRFIFISTGKHGQDVDWWWAHGFPFCLLVYYVSTFLFYHFAFIEAIVYYYYRLCKVSADAVEEIHNGDRAYAGKDRILTEEYKAASRRLILVVKEIDLINESYIY